MSVALRLLGKMRCINAKSFLRPEMILHQYHSRRDWYKMLLSFSIISITPNYLDYSQHRGVQLLFPECAAEALRQAHTLPTLGFA